MLETIKKIFRNKDFQKRLFFTLFIIFIVRLLQNFPLPFIDFEALKLKLEHTSQSSGASFFQNLNLFMGGTLERISIGVLGIFPYITASIIMQLLSPAFPRLKKLLKESEEGRQKYQQITRYLTIIISLVQSTFTVKYFTSQENEILILDFLSSSQFLVCSVIIFTTCSIVIMWLGEKISEKGLGSGASIIITISIISSLPQSIAIISENYINGDMDIIRLLLLIGLFIGITFATVLLVEGQRKITLQNTMSVAQRISKTNYLPLKLNYAGVMPIIFASPLLIFLSFILNQLPINSVTSFISLFLSQGTIQYLILYSFLIIVFSFFWVASQFNPLEIADDLKKTNNFIPGYRPGEATVSFLDTTMTRITSLGAIFLVILAIIPIILHSFFKTPFVVSQFFGGTSLLIIVGVILHTTQQVETQFVESSYSIFENKGFLKEGKN